MIEGRMVVLAFSDIFTVVQTKTPSFTMNSYISLMVCIFCMLKQSESGSESTNLVLQTCHCASLS